MSEVGLLAAHPLAIIMRGRAGASSSLVCRRLFLAVPAIWSAAIQHLGSRRMSTRFWYLDEYGLLSTLHDGIGLLLVILSYALILIRFRPPRPGRRRLWRQPGLAACVAATAGVAI